MGDFGELAYNAYTSSTGRDTLAWAELDEHIKDAWRAAATEGDSHYEESQDELPETFGFPEALSQLLSGAMVTREGWNAPGQWVGYVQNPQGVFVREDEDATFELSAFFALKNAQEELVAWVPSMGDLVAEDWRLAGRG